MIGDGNFSFSLSILTRLAAAKLTENISLTATSFDSRSELLSKYPESDHILNELKRKHASVFHGIDATKVLSTLQESRGDDGLITFDEIIFNFPHLGVEDMRKHQSLLAHVIHSCKEVMSDTSFLSIALADSQNTQWQL